MAFTVRESLSQQHRKKLLLETMIISTHLITSINHMWHIRSTLLYTTSLHLHHNLKYSLFIKAMLFKYSVSQIITRSFPTTCNSIKKNLKMSYLQFFGSTHSFGCHTHTHTRPASTYSTTKEASCLAVMERKEIYLDNAAIVT